MSHPLSGVIADIYDAALDKSLWQGVLARIADELNAGPSELTLMDLSKPTPDVNVYSRMPPDSGQYYFAEVYDIDIRIPRMLRMPDRGGIRMERILSRDEWRENPRIKQFLEDRDIGTLLASNHTTQGYVLWLGTARKGYDRPFNDQEIALYNVLLSHVDRAMRIHLALTDLKRSNSALGGLLSWIDKAVVLLDGHGRVLYANELAERLRNRKVISLNRDRLSLASARASRQLNASLRSFVGSRALDGEYADATLFTAPDGQQYGVRLLPCLGEAVSFNETEHLMIVTISNLETTASPSPAEIARFALVFRLTDAEAALLTDVATLRELSDIARDKGVRVDTVRKQVKSIMSKCGCHSQKELLRLIDRFCFVRMR